MSEAVLHQQVCDYLRLQHPDVLFRTDLGGLRMTMGQAARVKRLQGGRRAWPDIFISEPRSQYHGMYVELKAKTVYLKDGLTLKGDSHIQEQAAMLVALRDRGYFATFAVGFDQAKHLIDKYLSLGLMSRA